MPDETQRRYRFAAIDRASRWFYVEVLNDKSARSAQGFLKRLIKACPIKIQKILTDNGKEFTDLFCATGKRKPTATHLFDTICKQQGIEHRLITPRHPQTNGRQSSVSTAVSVIPSRPAVLIPLRAWNKPSSATEHSKGSDSNEAFKGVRFE